MLSAGRFDFSPSLPLGLAAVLPSADVKFLFDLMHTAQCAPLKIIASLIYLVTDISVCGY